MATQYYVEKRNTIAQRFPLMFQILKTYKRSAKVVMQDKGGSVKKFTISNAEFQARFIPAK